MFNLATAVLFFVFGYFVGKDPDEIKKGIKAVYEAIRAKLVK